MPSILLSCLVAFGSNWEPSESDITEEINTKLSSKSNLFPSGSRDEVCSVLAIWPR